MKPPVFNTIASDGTGISNLFKGINDHLSTMSENGDINEKKLERHRDRVRGLIREKLLNDFWTSEKITALDEKTFSINSIKDSPYQIYRDLLKNE